MFRILNNRRTVGAKRTNSGRGNGSRDGKVFSAQTCKRIVRRHYGGISSEGVVGSSRREWLLLRSNGVRGKRVIRGEDVAGAYSRGTKWAGTARGSERVVGAGGQGRWRREAQSRMAGHREGRNGISVGLWGRLKTEFGHGEGGRWCWLVIVSGRQRRDRRGPVKIQSRGGLVGSERSTSFGARHEVLHIWYLELTDLHWC